jgi:hypothetical protein
MNHHVIEIGTQRFWGKTCDLAPSRAPSRGTFSGCLLTSAPIALIWSIMIDQQRKRLDAREDCKLFYVAAAAGGPSRL